jgi:hypothetical protein
MNTMSLKATYQRSMKLICTFRIKNSLNNIIIGNKFLIRRATHKGKDKILHCMYVVHGWWCFTIKDMCNNLEKDRKDGGNGNGNSGGG